MSWKELFKQAVKLHKAGREGNKQAAAKAFQLLEKVRSMAPGNNLVEAYYGSALSLLGRDAVDPMEKLKKIQTGLKILDRCVANDPHNIQIRSLRGYVCLNVPQQYFNRARTAVEDFGYLISRYEKDRSVFSESFYRKLLSDYNKARAKASY